MHSTTPAADALLTLAIPFTLGYLVLCLIWPFTACRRCGGYGRLSGPFRGIRPCRHCDGTGLRLRLGRRLLNTLARLYRDLTDRHDR